MSKKYIIANIKLPIEILDDGTYNTITERAIIDFGNCVELPPLQEHKNINFNNLFKEQNSQIEEHYSVDENNKNNTDNIYYVIKKELNKKQNLNVSFKNKKKYESKTQYIKSKKYNTKNTEKKYNYN